MAQPTWLAELIEYTPTLFVGVGGIGALGYLVVRHLYRRIVRDGLEVAKDRGETDFVQKLIDHNNALTQSNASLRADFERLSIERATTLSSKGKLESDLEHTRAQLAEAHTDIALLRRQIGNRLLAGGPHET